MKSEKLSDFVTAPRRIYRSYEGGEITATEYYLYMTLRNIADIKGVAHVKSYGWLAGRMPGNKKLKPNTVGKALKSLLDKREISFNPSQGIRSGYKVYLMDWPLETGVVRTSENFFDKKPVTSDDIVRNEANDESDPMSLPKNHMSDYEKRSPRNGFSPSSVSDEITSRYNDNNNIKKNENTIACNKGMECIPTASFRADTLNEGRLVDFARLCGDRCINFYLGKFKEYGERAIEAMERAEVIYLEVTSKSQIINKPAYFNSLVCDELSKT